MKKIVLIMLIFLMCIIFTSLVYSTVDCIGNYHLREYNVITNLNLINIKTDSGTSFLINSGNPSEEIFDDFIFKFVNISGQENIIDDSQFKRMYGLDESGQWVLKDIYLILRQDFEYPPKIGNCETGIKIYKKDIGELVYSSEFKLFYSSCGYDEPKELCPREGNLSFIEKIIDWFKNLFSF